MFWCHNSLRLAGCWTNVHPTPSLHFFSYSASSKNITGNRQWCLLSCSCFGDFWHTATVERTQQHEHYAGLYYMSTDTLAFNQSFTTGIWKLPGSCINILHPFITTQDFRFYRNILKKSQGENVVLSTPTSEVVVGMGQETSNRFDGWGVRVRTDLFFPFLASEAVREGIRKLQLPLRIVSEQVLTRSLLFSFPIHKFHLRYKTFPQHFWRRPSTEGGFAGKSLSFTRSYPHCFKAYISCKQLLQLTCFHSGSVIQNISSDEEVIFKAVNSLHKHKHA